MRINHNIGALNTYNQLNAGTTKAGKSMEKLASGLRINRAGDDAAGLAISEKMRAQVRGLDQAGRNAQDGISLIQTAEGALSETHSILQRMRELSVQSANGTNTGEDRGAIQTELNQLKSEIDRIGNTTEFNTQKLLNGSLKSTAGASVGQNQTLGSQIAKLESGKFTSSGTFALGSGVRASGTDFKEEKIKIDGTEITVKWQNLTSEEKAVLQAGTTSGASKTDQNKAAELITNKINAAIDDSGKAIAHVKGYVDSSNKLIIESGTEGVKSSVKLDVSGSSGVFKKVFGTASGTSGTAKYNGTAIVAGDSFGMKINGIDIKISGLAVGNGDALKSVASGLQTALNGRISGYNTQAGKVQGDKGYIEKVTVQATDDGKLIINSQSGPVSFEDTPGKTTVKDLGLSSAQTEAAGNGGMTFQIGANRSQTLTFGIDDMRSASLGVSSVDASTATSAQTAIITLDAAIKKVSSERSKIGAVQNRLEHTIANLGTASENLTGAESRIRDVDMAKEMMEFTKNNILSQAAQSMLAQANQQPQGVLQLLR